MAKLVAGVLVLGDIGRSPRMQYHSISLATQANFNVHIVAYQENEPREELVQNKDIEIHKIKPFPAINRKYFLLLAPFKLFYQFFQLIYTLLFVIPTMDMILIQNPPSIPVLAIVYFIQIYYKLVKRKKLLWVIDWHNFGYSILALSFGTRHPVVRIARTYEKYFGQKADLHLCVTHAMKKFLSNPNNHWNIPDDKITVLHDTPPSFFHQTSLQEKHELFLRLADIFNNPINSQPDDYNNNNNKRNINNDDGDAVEVTPFTYKTNRGDIFLRDDRPALIISSTSWTADEDFSVMLDAIERLDRLIIESSLPQFRHFYFVITGKGPQKEYYEKKISSLRLQYSSIKTAWTSANDYPLILGSADMGISMHTSSSGLDLPMKVVDMFGCKLPVLSFEFECISELVRDRENGRVFSDYLQLADHLFDIFRDRELEDLNRMRKNISMPSWHQNWGDHFLSLLQRQFPNGQRKPLSIIALLFQVAFILIIIFVLKFLIF